MSEAPEMSSISELFKILVEDLQAIDREAVPRPNGLATGLRWYAGHVDSGLSVYATDRSEDLWSQRLQKLLGGQGITVDYQCPYPESRKKCDLVIHWPYNSRFWLEVKRSYRECVYPDGTKSNSAFLRYLSETADDLDKLSVLTPPGATHVGLLLVGFDRPERPIRDNDLNPITERAATGRWSCESNQWDDRWYPGFRVRIWLWSRPAEVAAKECGIPEPSIRPVQPPDIPMVVIGQIGKIEAIIRSFIGSRADFPWEQMLVEVARKCYGVPDAPRGNEVFAVVVGKSTYRVCGTGLAPWNSAARNLGARVRELESPYRSANYRNSSRVRDLALEIERGFFDLVNGS